MDCWKYNFLIPVPGKLHFINSYLPLLEGDIIVQGQEQKEFALSSLEDSGNRAGGSGRTFAALSPDNTEGYFLITFLVHLLLTALHHEVTSSWILHTGSAGIRKGNYF